MTLEPAYFDRMYAASDDPWGFTSRWYERRKYALTLAMLPSERYADAFEPGCSIGVMTEQLAPRCARLLSCDGSRAAVRAAARRTSGQPSVCVEQRVLPRDWPPGNFDLIVFSELLYYFGGDDLQQLLKLSVAALRPGGTLLAVHWRHPVPEYPRSGDNVHQVLASQPGLSRIAEHREPDFIAEVYLHGPALSVAQATGLV
ncbi:MAG: methyltransferase domain-containing protein [Streptosporangiaceae bacterium]|nr:methyltransferase domain-containing protein [Streptosporangiaceae bacterium]